MSKFFFKKGIYTEGGLFGFFYRHYLLDGINVCFWKNVNT